MESLIARLLAAGPAGPQEDGTDAGYRHELLQAGLEVPMHLPHLQLILCIHGVHKLQDFCEIISTLEEEAEDSSKAWSIDSRLQLTKKTERAYRWQPCCQVRDL